MCVHVHTHIHTHSHTHCCWSLLHGAIICSRADSLRFVVWLWMSDCSLLKHLFEYPLQWCIYSAVCYMASATWNCCCLGTCSVDTIQLRTSLQCHSCYVPLTWPCLDHNFFHKALAHSQNSKPYQFMAIVIIIKLKASSACACSRQTPPPHTSIQGGQEEAAGAVITMHWSPSACMRSFLSRSFFSLLHLWSLAVCHLQLSSCVQHRKLSKCESKWVLWCRCHDCSCNKSRQ